MSGLYRSDWLTSSLPGLVMLTGMALAWAGCCPASVPPTNVEPPSSQRAPVDITLLYTSDEHGWLQPRKDETHGGLQQLLAQLVHDEGHCAGAWPGEPQPSCTPSHTLLLSGGDNYTGPAISSFFRGETTASALRRLGYAASAFGNHELDFGHETYFDNQKRAGLVYLAANISGQQPGIAPLTKPYLVIERAGVQIGVIGLATPETPKTAAPHRFEGLSFDDIEATLQRVVPQVWAEQVDAVVLVAHECGEELRGPIERHPEWRLSFAGGGHCHKSYEVMVGEVPLMAPAWQVRRYARIRLRIDPNQPLKQRAKLIDHRMVRVAPRLDRAQEDEAFERRMARWEREVNAKLGEPIGYTNSGLARTSPEISRWILRSWREATGADIAVTTQGGIRQQLPAGSITRESVLSVLPFDNKLVICELPGSALASLLDHKGARVEGVARDEAGALVMHDGKRVDPAQTYRVVTTDFLYAGGDGMPFAQHDDSPEHTHTSWRDPVVAWTLEHKSNENEPIEKLLGP